MTTIDDEINQENIKEYDNSVNEEKNELFEKDEKLENKEEEKKDEELEKGDEEEEDEDDDEDDDEEGDEDKEEDSKILLKSFFDKFNDTNEIILEKVEPDILLDEDIKNKYFKDFDSEFLKSSKIILLKK
jgi:hypothetical protein